MATVLQVLERIQALQAGIEGQITTIIQATGFELTTLVQIQLQQGTDSTEAKIKPEYRGKSYATYKQRLNPAPGFGVPDLFVTGSMYQGMGVAILDNDRYEIKSTVEYYPKLVSQYGDNPFKLSDKSKSEYAQTVFYERLKRYVSDTTQLL